ncbi:MAG: hypothetical protein HRT64_04545 [Erythrobacter sp.]|nr:hypothetical protein [Erythrobacter sp.]
MKYRGMSPEAQALFERHDMIHVLFGLSTDVRDEAKADGWTLLGSDISFAEIRRFAALPEEKELVQELGWAHIAKAFLRAIPDYAVMAWRSRRLTKRWRWADNAQYRDRTVAAIRREFGIDAALA